MVLLALHQLLPVMTPHVDCFTEGFIPAKEGLHMCKDRHVWSTKQEHLPHAQRLASGDGQRHAPGNPSPQIIPKMVVT